MTPTPVDLTAPPAAVAVATFTPVSVRILIPTESATGIATATAIPSAAPGPIESALVALTESALVALVMNPTSIPAPTDVPLAAVSLPPTDTAIPPVAPALPPSADAACAPLCGVAAAEQYTVDLINAQRAAAGVPLLLRDETLMGIARARVADMVARGYTGHDDPVTGEHLARRMMRAAGYTSSYLGENWYGSIYSPPAIVDTAMAWFMTDAPHANNILSPNFVGVGAGIAFNGQQWLLVQDFAGPNP